MPRSNFLEGFLAWMLKTGKKPRKRERPSLPLAPSGAQAKFKLIRRILIDLGYVKHEPNGTNGGKYSVWPSKDCKRIYNLKPQEFINWSNEKFPDLSSRQQKTRKGAYIYSMWKFGEYLHWEMKDSNGKVLWKKKDLEKLKEDIYPPHIKKFEVEILPLEKIDGLIEYIKGVNITHYTMVFLSRWLGGMRYQEVINAPLDLDGKTLKINFSTKRVTIWGKGEGGLQKERQPTLIPTVEKVIKAYLKYRSTLTPATKEDGKYLFLNRFGKKFSDSSASLNDPLKYHANNWGQLDKKEIKLISSHRVGRHGFGTFFYGKMGDKLLMQEMGLEDPKTLFRYANITRDTRAEIVREIATQGRSEAPQEASPVDFNSIIERIKANHLTKEQKAQIFAELV